MATPIQLILKATEVAEDKWGLKTQVALRFALAAYFTEVLTGERPRIFSGFRSLERQRALYDGWKQGEESYRPARFSWHTTGHAFDVERMSAQATAVFVALWKWMGGRWGGDFKTPDPPHFDFPAGSSPPAAW